MHSCLGLSCPYIETYNGDGSVTEELDNAGEMFLTREVNVIMGESGLVVELSKILDWYKTDFGEDEREMVEWIKDRINGKLIISKLNALPACTNECTLSLALFSLSK